MALYNINGDEISKQFDYIGNETKTIYDIKGNPIHLNEKKFNTFSVLGDSYSAYIGTVTPSDNLCWYPSTDATVQGYGKGNNVSNPAQMWFNLFSEEYGCILQQNNSRSGSPICNDGWGSGTADAVNYSFVARCNDISNAELLIVFGGTNDSWIGVSQGNYIYSDWTTEDLTKYRPALAYIFDTLKKNNPNSTIIFVQNTGLKSEIVTANNEICNHYGVGLVALNNISKTADHPNIYGMIKIKDQIINFLNTL
jgi:hypothetical protein